MPFTACIGAVIGYFCCQRTRKIFILAALLFCAASILNPPSTHPAALLSLGVPVSGAALQLLLLSPNSHPQYLPSLTVSFFFAPLSFTVVSLFAAFSSCTTVHSSCLVLARERRCPPALCSPPFKSFSVKIRCLVFPFPSSENSQCKKKANWCV